MREPFTRIVTSGPAKAGDYWMSCLRGRDVCREGRISDSVIRRHCEPTGRANARPMTGAAPPDDKLREAIQLSCNNKKGGLLRRKGSSQ